MGDTSIEWCDKTWNPLRGCTPVSEGCRNCYAATVAARFSGPGQAYEGLAQMTEKGPRWTGEVREVLDHVGDPLRWRKPRRVFVNSMSDLFHPLVTDQFIAKVFAVMAVAPQHTFQVLTKRPQRMATLLADPGFIAAMAKEAEALPPVETRWPLPNVWLGTSVEDQEAADTRIPALLRTPAAVRFLSCEPLLGPLNLRLPSMEIHENVGKIVIADFSFDLLEPHKVEVASSGLHWVIVGGESGHGARPMDLSWARSLRDQCRSAGVAFFFKQTGAVAATASKKGGADEDIPEDLRIRDFPVVA